MRNVRLLVEYEGTAYCGWQVQENGPTVQATLIEAVRELTGEDIALRGASRTDAGVHALGQVAAFFTESTIPPAGMRTALNALLPGDIVIKEASDAPLEFDPRRDSKNKTYVYRIVNRRYPSALLRNFAWLVYKPLDVNLMREAARHFIGEKDFTSFCAAGSDAAHSIREVISVDIEDKNGEEEGLIEVKVVGTAFLRHMIRIMAGTLVEAGRGKLKPGDVPAIIEAKDRASAPQTAPPQGLCLVRIEY